MVLCSFVRCDNWRPYLRDPKDDLVLELAVGSQSAETVTYDIHDFVGIEKFGIRLIRPADFLSELGVKQ
jgi:predicted nucleic acid-binding protein